MCESMHRTIHGKEVIEDRSEEVEGAEAGKVVPPGDYLDRLSAHQDTSYEPSRRFRRDADDALYLPRIGRYHGVILLPREGVEHEHIFEV